MGSLPPSRPARIFPQEYIGPKVSQTRFLGWIRVLKSWVGVAVIIGSIALSGKIEAQTNKSQYVELDGPGTLYHFVNCATYACAKITTGTVKEIFLFDPYLFNKIPSGALQQTGSFISTPWMYLVSVSLNNSNITPLFQSPPSRPSGIFVTKFSEADIGPSYPGFHASSANWNEFYDKNWPSSIEWGYNVSADNTIQSTVNFKNISLQPNGRMPLIQTSASGLAYSMLTDQSGGAEPYVTTGYQLVVNTGTATLTAPPFPRIEVLDPFLLAPKQLPIINLPQIIKDTDLSASQASGLESDGASAAIVLVAVDKSSDLQLSVSNGATLLPYCDPNCDPDFLTKSPKLGTSTLIIPAAKLMTIGSALYAAALVQAPAIGAPTSYSSPIVITAQAPGGQLQSTSIDLVPPPVILIHGIWGTSDSMKNIRAFLAQTSPWSEGAQLLSINYPNSISFNSAASTAALSSGIASAMENLDKEHVVGGRVDIVAHSMGGLLSRYYTTLTSEYNTFRDRNLGRFHEVISLDTPEYGSALAPFLLKNAPTLYNSSTDNVSSAIWKIAGCQTTDTVQQCFSRLGLPLAAPGQDLSSGAVASLTPGGVIAETPFPDQIPNVIWRSVSAVRPQHTTVLTGESMLQVELERLVAAVYPAGKAPSIAQILSDGGTDDVIVTLTSQLAKAPNYPKSGEFVTLPGLSHSPAPETLHYKNWSLNNGNVEDDPNVNQAVACWLKTDGAASCAQSAVKPARIWNASAENQIEIDNQALAARPDAQLRLVDRLSVPQKFDATLAAPNKITIGVNGCTELLDLTVAQSDGLGHRFEAHPTIKCIGGGRASVEIMPMLPGSVRFTFAAAFRDGSAAVQNAETQVGMAEVAPERLFSDITFQDAPPNTGSITIDPQFGVYQLQPMAIYATMPGTPIDVTRIVSYRVVADGKPPAVSISPDGKIHALRVGDSTIELHLGATSSFVKVSVQRPQH
jgi:pimeloyl-ACP methyl ester carboxylesterase